MERQYGKLVGCFGVMCLIVFGVLAADVYGEPLVDNGETADYVVDYENMTNWAYETDVWGNPVNGYYWRRASFDPSLSGYLVYHLQNMYRVELVMRRHSNGQIENIILEVRADETEEWQRITFDVLNDQHTQGGWRDFRIAADLESLGRSVNYLRITIAEPNAAWHPCIETVILRGRVSAW